MFTTTLVVISAVLFIIFTLAFMIQYHLEKQHQYNKLVQTLSNLSGIDKQTLQKVFTMSELKKFGQILAGIEALPKEESDDVVKHLRNNIRSLIQERSVRIKSELICKIKKLQQTTTQ